MYHIEAGFPITGDKQNRVLLHSEGVMHYFLSHCASCNSKFNSSKSFTFPICQNVFIHIKHLQFMYDA